MLKEFSGGVWIEPSEIVGLDSEWCGENHARISAFLRGGCKIQFWCPEKVADQNKPLVEAEAWIRNYLAEQKAAQDACTFQSWIEDAVNVAIQPIYEDGSRHVGSRVEYRDQQNVLRTAQFEGPEHHTRAEAYVRSLLHHLPKPQAAAAPPSSAATRPPADAPPQATDSPAAVQAGH